MRYAHTVEQVREAEEAAARSATDKGGGGRREGSLMARLPDGVLMQRAAAGLAATCSGLLSDGRPGRVYGSRVVVLAGSGDNGGDALFAGARLAARGARVHAVLLAPARAHGAGLAALLDAGGRALAPSADRTEDQRRGLAEIERADLVLDGIVGIGGRGGLRAGALPYVRAAERSGVPLVAVDLPSGVDADTGEVPGEAVRATVTVTFGTHKPGLLVDPGAGYAGVVRLVDIGIEPPAPVLTVLQHADVAALLPRPAAESDKYRRGVVGVAAGSERYPGAAVLAVAAALHGGAGAVRYAGSAAREVVRAHPEVLVTEAGPKHAGRVQAWVVGPGLSDGAEAEQTLEQAIAAGVPLLVDADGLRLLARRGGTAHPGMLLTPHAGEAVALFAGAGEEVTRDQVEAARLEHVRRLAALYRCTVLLKGSTTVVAGPEGPARVNPTGTSWLATAGSGDVLSGLAGALLAAGLAPLDAGSVAAYLHGLAARIAAAGAAGRAGARITAVPGAVSGAPVTATEVVAALPAAWRSVSGGQETVLSDLDRFR
ncbi:NAD(P)H-hydrate dehydratase [Streptacidiphilus sp. EB129]|uniref:NAD(P)H-hydrate dehydratase n=1 Tax=Streptacidiphilus sp. EB129 TaxID=3156262 RepID=UPI003518A3D4